MARLKEISVPGDGNCQFYSLSRVLREKNIDNISHRDLRKLAVNIIKSDREHFMSFVPSDDHNTYIRDMTRNKTYGDNITLSAIALNYGIKIIVLRPHGPKNIINPSGNPHVILKYYGDDGADAHYNPVIENSCKQSNRSERVSKK